MLAAAEKHSIRIRGVLGCWIGIFSLHCISSAPRSCLLWRLGADIPTGAHSVFKFSRVIFTVSYIHTVLRMAGLYRIWSEAEVCERAVSGAARSCLRLRERGTSYFLLVIIRTQTRSLVYSDVRPKEACIMFRWHRKQIQRGLL